MKHIYAFFLSLALILSSTLAMAEGMVNINTASAQEMAEQIDGVGLKKAEAIVQYREQHGNFKSVAELSSVSGIGLRIVEKNQDILTVGTSVAE